MPQKQAQHMKKRAGQIDLSASDCQKICLAASLGGKESVKGNRQGFLSRSITRRSGRIEK